MKQHFSDDKFGHPIYYEPITSEEWKDGLIELRLPRKPEALREGYCIRSDKIPLTVICLLNSYLIVDTVIIIIRSQNEKLTHQLEAGNVKGMQKGNMSFIHQE